MQVSQAAVTSDRVAVFLDVYFTRFPRSVGKTPGFVAWEGRGPARRARGRKAPPWAPECPAASRWAASPSPRRVLAFRGAVFNTRNALGAAPGTPCTLAAAVLTSSRRRRPVHGHVTDLFVFHFSLFGLFFFLIIQNITVRVEQKQGRARRAVPGPLLPV